MLTLGQNEQTLKNERFLTVYTERKTDCHSSLYLQQYVHTFTVHTPTHTHTHTAAHAASFCSSKLLS